MNTSASTKFPLTHPAGLWFIAIMNTLMCVGFGAINSQLVLYAPSVLHLKAAKFYPLSSTYNALLFTLPLLGGYLAEKLGYRRTLLYSTALCIAGLVFFALTTVTFMYLGLAAFSVGACLFVPSYLVLQGKLYAKDDPRRESAFTLSYIIMNIGFFLAGFFGGYVARFLGYRDMFFIAAAILTLVYIIYFFGRKTLVPYGNREIKAQLNWSKTSLWSALIAGSLALLACAYWLLTHTTETTPLLFGLVVITTILLTVIAMREKTTLGRQRIIAFLILSYFSIAFWALYALEPSLLTIFIRDNVNRLVFGGTVPAAAYYSLDAIFVIALGLFTSWLWKRLEAKGNDLSLPTKFSLSLLVMSLGMLLIPLAIYLTGLDHKINSSWIVLLYAFLALAELLIGPIGQSMVGRLSPEGMEGGFMGAWQLFTGFSGAFSVYLDNLAVVPKNLSLSASNLVYTEAFLKIGGTAFVMSLLSMFLIRYVKKLIA